MSSSSCFGSLVSQKSLADLAHSMAGTWPHHGSQVQFQTIGLDAQISIVSLVVSLWVSWRLDGAWMAPVAAISVRCWLAHPTMNLLWMIFFVLQSYRILSISCKIGSGFFVVEAHVTPCELFMPGPELEIVLQRLWNHGSSRFLSMFFQKKTCLPCLVTVGSNPRGIRSNNTKIYQVALETQARFPFAAISLVWQPSWMSLICCPNFFRLMDHDGSRWILPLFGRGLEIGDSSSHDRRGLARDSQWLS